MSLELQGITKKLDAFELPAVNLTVRAGEYFVLIGPSGVGKTVLLEIIAGLLRPDAGCVRWHGVDVTNRPPEQRSFSIMYQDYALFPHMTVEQNIMYGMNSRRVAKDEAQARVAEITGLLHIAELLHRFPHTLSGGEQQRVALARALVVKPELVLLDEPLSAVDMHLRHKLQRELKEVQERSRTTFLHVTHDVHEAIRLGHRVGVMLDGQLHQIGSPEELFHKPTDNDVAGFLGMRNIFAVGWCDDGFCEAGGVKIHVGKRPHSYRYIWIRPEEILLSREPFESSARNQLRCAVIDWEFHRVLVNIRLAVEDLIVSVMVTYVSFEKLGIAEGTELCATFKSSAVHCF
ncbi:MAG: ATP-binding cassette domain-containing protein [Candidatus Latescibacterota bacterium]